MTINSTRGNFSQEIVNPYISDWYKTSIHVGALPDFTVSLIGVRGASYTGDIAIDDTAFVNCAPSGAPSKPEIMVASGDMNITAEQHEFMLDCSMKGNLAPDISWMHKGKKAVNCEPFPNISYNVGTSHSSFGQSFKFQ